MISAFSFESERRGVGMKDLNSRSAVKVFLRGHEGDRFDTMACSGADSCSWAGDVGVKWRTMVWERDSGV